MGDLLFGLITWMLTGYLIGLTVGFTLFDPNTDIYALLGAVLAIGGAILGLTPPLRRYTHLALGAIIGFYLGAVLSIVLFGNPASDGLPEVVRSGKLIVVLIGTVMGIVLTQRYFGETNRLIAAAFLFGGFFGGLLLATIGIAPRLSMVGIAPYFIGCGVLCAAAVWFMTRQAE